MKITACLLLGAYATTALATTDANAEARAAAEAECGALGVMEFDPADLPEGVLPSDVRKCREHPLSHLPDPGDWPTLRSWLPDWVF
ncbi:hypothetical protein BDV12DRAFT_170031 [Aspergillus spectabilis]